ncbi:MAG: hypothetical protein GXY81_08110 [Candidatus Cloacimonetes bacterium]|nr:hypothetical protein [Candidatus Cloacimonadota bacterium]
MTKDKILKFKKSLSRVCGDYAQTLEFELFFSALIDFNPFGDTSQVLEWLSGLNSRQYFEVEEVPFANLQQWHFSPQTGDLQHHSGKFFSIRGCRVLDVKTGETLWDQPIIDQPEVGILGILCKKMDGVLYFLMQAKAEPGNINTYQLSPTVQATRSNFLQVHGGKKTRYLDYFSGERKCRVVIDRYQSEQGARFLGKRNRNLLVLDESGSDVELGENFRWLTLGQIKSLMERDNTVNMDTRSVISQIHYWGYHPDLDHEALAKVISEHRDLVARSDFWLLAVLGGWDNFGNLDQTDKILNKLAWTRHYSFKDKAAVPLNSVQEWKIGEQMIEHREGRFFQVLAVSVRANNREVGHWDQPVIKQRHEGKIGLLAAPQYGAIHFLTQIKMEPGLYDMFELAPTVQCIVQNRVFHNQPAYLEHFENGTNVYAARQSEEGGRFYRECSLNMIRVLDGFNDLEPVEGFVWIPLRQLKELLRHQQVVNVELRSLLAYF